MAEWAKGKGGDVDDPDHGGREEDVVSFFPGFRVRSGWLESVRGSLLESPFDVAGRIDDVTTWVAAVHAAP